MTSSRPHNFTTSQLHDFTTSRLLHNFKTSSQLHFTTLLISLLSNTTCFGVVDDKILDGGDVGGVQLTFKGESDVDEVGDLVKSTNNYFGEMMLIFDLLEALEMEALVDAMDVDNG
ncbi:hypothetical protein Tco_1125439 [Tanacetum coccineum]|uniref:Uncharacterized protein n=1 Tax=Tanacetum coccineum TaxID=301880 RepID=A0ABQ5J8Z4_9ASTR